MSAAATPRGAGREGASRSSPGPSEGPPAAGSLRHRLLAALVLTSAGSVALAALILVVFARPVERHQAVSDMRRALAQLAFEDQRGELFRLNAGLVRIRAGGSGAQIVSVLPGGRISTDPADVAAAIRPVATPRTGVTGRSGPASARGAQRERLAPLGAAIIRRLDASELAAGEAQSGASGSTVFVAQPLVSRPAGTPVVIATRRVGPVALDPLGGIVLLAGIAAAVVAAGVSAVLVRRLTRPLARMEHTTRAIAGGDLSARVGGLAGTDDELAALGAAIDTMAAELERGRGLERAFLMSVSHDLRTPLTSIRGYAAALADGAADDDESRARAAAVIGAEARRLERLVADLLDLARLDSREFSLHMGPTDAAATATQAVAALGPAAAAAGLTLRCVLPPRPAGRAPGTPAGVWALADPERLAQVVANLVENALKYAATSVEVAVGADEGAGAGGAAGPVAGGIVRIAVTDDGPGIDPVDLPRVFERLYTSRGRPGRKLGTGLGLAIVAQLTGAMGGRVAVDGTPGAGTRFVVELSGASGGGTPTSPTSSTSSRTTGTSSPS